MIVKFDKYNEGVRNLMTGKSEEDIKKSLEKLSPNKKLEKIFRYRMQYMFKDELNGLLLSVLENAPLDEITSLIIDYTPYLEKILGKSEINKIIKYLPENNILKIIRYRPMIYNDDETYKILKRSLKYVVDLSYDDLVYFWKIGDDSVKKEIEKYCEESKNSKSLDNLKKNICKTCVVKDYKYSNLFKINEGVRNLMTPKSEDSIRKLMNDYFHLNKVNKKYNIIPAFDEMEFFDLDNLYCIIDYEDYYEDIDKYFEDMGDHEKYKVKDGDSGIFTCYPNLKISFYDDGLMTYSWYFDGSHIDGIINHIIKNS